VHSPGGLKLWNSRTRLLLKIKILGLMSGVEIKNAKNLATTGGLFVFARLN
jgi:hypothetical protein